MDIGIDLGTTFSVIAVKGRASLSPNYGSGTYLPECDVTIIPSPVGDSTFPSVFYWDPEEPDTVLVGVEAKQKAEEGKAPVMFSKRSIGTKQLLRVGGRDFTAKQVATEFLKYFKSCAEQALGQPVRRAVVTHPAYFDRNQVEETLQAAKDAGFEMAPEQLIMEPVAAALAYTQNDERDPLRVMTYDLGGGTFDVTVLEKREGVISMKAFDGDHLLGGYNFDRALAQWMLDQVKAQGRSIPFDENNEEDQGRRARLLLVAESVKLKLSEQRSPKVPVPIKLDFLVDDHGQRAQFVGKISREQFAALIQDELQKTVDCCNGALAKAGVAASELDAILLVGGSTYGPWVHETLQSAFGVGVEPYNPDLCVAAGAAIEAAKLPPVRTGDEVEVAVDVRPSSPLPNVNVPGRVRPRPGSRFESGCSGLLVMLTTPRGVSLSPAPIGADGLFLFSDVPLGDEGVPGEFTLTVADGTLELARLSFAITYEPTGGAETTINSTLPKPVYLRTAEGLVSVADEGRELPAKCEIRLKRLFDGDTVSVDVVQESERIGTIIVDGIREPASRANLIVISVEITPRNEMRGSAQVKTAEGTVLAQKDVRIAFPPIPVPEVNELAARFDDLRNKREEKLLLSEDPTERLRLEGQGGKLIRRIEKKFAEQSPDRQELAREIRLLDQMVNPPADDMEPPRAEFLAVVDSCREMLASKPEDPNVQAFNPMVKRLENEGSDAHTTKNRRKWAAVNDSLRQLHDRVRKLVMPEQSGSSGGGDLPPTELLKDHFHNEVDGLRAALRMAREKAERRANYTIRDKPRCDELERRIDALDQAINKIDNQLAPKQALAQLQLATRPSQEIKDRTRWIDEGIEVGKT